MSFEEIKTLASGLGISFHPAIGEEKLKEKVEKFVSENPGCLGSDEPVAAEVSMEGTTAADEAAADKTAADGKVKIKSEFVGEISSPFGVIDFGEDGIVELDQEAAEFFCSLPRGYSKC